MSNERNFSLNSDVNLNMHSFGELYNTIKRVQSTRLWVSWGQTFVSMRHLFWKETPGPLQWWAWHRAEACDGVVLTDHRGTRRLYGCIGHVGQVGPRHRQPRASETDLCRRPAAPGGGGEIRPTQPNRYLY